MPKRFLVAPGPTPVPEEARLAMAASLIHHRGPEFREIFEEVRRDLAWAHQTNGDVVILTCSGTGGFEAALTAFTNPGDTIVSVGGGKFGERWGDMGRAVGLDVVDVDVEWGSAVDPDSVALALDVNPNTVAVTLTASETSTGVLHPVADVARVVREHSDAIFIVDGITAVGVHPLSMAELGIDVLVSGSQKAFAVPPGLAFVAVQEEAWEQVETEHSRYYLDLIRERDGQRKGKTAFTPAISPVIALQPVLRSMRAEGLDAIWARHALLAEATRAGVVAAGLELFASTPSNAVTAATVPDGIAAPELVAMMREKYGVTIAGGQAGLKPRLIRIGHLGQMEWSDVIIALAALESALADLGADIEPGAAVTAAQRVFIESESA
jgi:aspartate aminotransferase-like enzyme